MPNFLGRWYRFFNNDLCRIHYSASRLFSWRCWWWWRWRSRGRSHFWWGRLSQADCFVVEYDRWDQIICLKLSNEILDGCASLFPLAACHRATRIYRKHDHESLLLRSQFELNILLSIQQALIVLRQKKRLMPDWKTKFERYLVEDRLDFVAVDSVKLTIRLLRNPLQHGLAFPIKANTNEDVLEELLWYFAADFLENFVELVLGHLWARVLTISDYHVHKIPKAN